MAAAALTKNIHEDGFDLLVGEEDIEGGNHLHSTAYIRAIVQTRSQGEIFI